MDARMCPDLQEFIYVDKDPLPQSPSPKKDKNDSASHFI